MHNADAEANLEWMRQRIAEANLYAVQVQRVITKHAGNAEAAIAELIALQREKEIDTNG